MTLAAPTTAINNDALAHFQQRAEAAAATAGTELDQATHASKDLEDGMVEVTFAKRAGTKG